MPESNPGSIAEILKWGWVGLGGIAIWVWQRLVGSVDQLKADLSNHVMDDLKSHDDFVQKDELKELQASLTRRFDQLDAKGEDILKHLMEGVSRSEFKDEMKGVYSSIDDLRKTKVDK